MSQTITLPCADGTDIDCKGSQTFELWLDGLTADQLDQITESNGSTSIALSPQEMEINGLSKDSPCIDYCEQEHQAWYEIQLDTTCCFCGSDQ
jgi:hypothetical protein